MSQLNLKTICDRINKVQRSERPWLTDSGQTTWSQLSVKIMLHTSIWGDILVIYIWSTSSKEEKESTSIDCTFKLLSEGQIPEDIHYSCSLEYSRGETDESEKNSTRQNKNYRSCWRSECHSRLTHSGDEEQERGKNHSSVFLHQRMGHPPSRIFRFNMAVVVVVVCVCAHPQQCADSCVTELKVLKDHWELQYDSVAGSLGGGGSVILQSEHAQVYGSKVKGQEDTPDFKEVIEGGVAQGAFILQILKMINGLVSRLYTTGPKVLEHLKFSSLYWNVSSSSPVNHLKWYKGQRQTARGHTKKFRGPKTER